MKIINLIENTCGSSDCIYAHGLSFYVETPKHKLLLDLGPSEDTLKNAEKLGIDLKNVDLVILSHGHYDHSGGILPFSDINSSAVIYMQKAAFDDYYADDGELAREQRFRYIGINKHIKELPQIKPVEGDYQIDDELSLFVLDKHIEKIPFTNARLKRKVEASYIQDDFKHEHFLVIKDGDKSVLMSGCAHNGIINILQEYKRKYGADPDAVISGFHLMKKSDYTDDELAEITDTARKLKGYNTMFYTCHCTGLIAYDAMKDIMGSKLEYVHSGDEVKINLPLLDR